jgi:importin subunit beta-1
LQDASAGSSDPDTVNHHFIKAALPHLVPLLLEQLTKQEEGQETDDGVWNVSMAAGTCLALCASVADDAIVPLVMPFVTANIQKTDGAESWRYREAATFAFGSILEGPGVEMLGQLVQSGLGFLLTALKQDPNAHVKDTTAWTIGRIFEFVHGEDSPAPLLGPQNLPQVVEALLMAIRDAPHIAEKVCYALSQLAGGFYEVRGTSPMSPYFKDVVQALLETAARPADLAEQTRLQTQAFEAINEVVRASAADTTPMVVQLIPLVVSKLNETLHMNTAGSMEAAERQSEIQGLLCGMTQVIVQKLSDSDNAKAGVLQVRRLHCWLLLVVVAGCRLRVRVQLAIR